MRLLICGTVVSNGGDRAILESELDQLQADGIEIAVTDNLPHVATRLFPAVRVDPWVFDTLSLLTVGPRRLRAVARRLAIGKVLLAAHLMRLGRRNLAARLASPTEWRALANIERAAAVMQTGGTTFVESYFLAPKFLELAVGHALGKPLVLLTQSLGPFARRSHRRAMRRLAGRAELILLRDEQSLDHLREIGARTDRCVVLPDIVFALATEASAKALATRRLPGRPSVAISVRELGNYKHLAATGAPERFVRAVRELVVHLVSRYDADVTFTSTCQGISEYWTDDSRAAEVIVAGLDEAVRKRVIIDSAARSTPGLVAHLSHFDVLVATRLHAAILSLVAGTLVLPIAYEFKTRTVFADLGLPDLPLDVSSIDGPALISAFDDLADSEQSIRKVLAALLPPTAGKAAQAASLVRQALSSRDAHLAP